MHKWRNVPNKYNAHVYMYHVYVLLYDVCVYILYIDQKYFRLYVSKETYKTDKKMIKLSVDSDLTSANALVVYAPLKFCLYVMSLG